MKTLIINSCRTGSTSLFNKLCEERKCKGYFNPWANGEESQILWSLDSFVVKCGVIYNPIKETDPNGHRLFFNQQQINWFKELAEKFDEVILLSRKDTLAHIESFMHLLQYNSPDQYQAAKNGDESAYTSTSQWTYNEGEYDNMIRVRAGNDIANQTRLLRMLSKQLNIPLRYYEDYFDPNGEGRYRKIRKSTIL